MKSRVPICALALVSLAALGACRPKARPVAPAGNTAAAATAAQSNGAAAPQKDAAVPPPEAVPACTDDRQCFEYMRCEAGQCAVPPAIEGREVEGMPTAVFTLEDRELATFKLEIADDSWERTRGLMYRRKMHPDFGMLFIFDEDEVRAFWMKNTLIPLDMVHIDSHGLVVGVVEKAEPMTLSPRRTDEPARYVLELTSGRAAEVGIVKGARMTLTGLPAELSPQ